MRIGRRSHFLIRTLRVPLLLFAGVPGTGPVIAPAQPPASGAPTFRAGTEEVLVDVSVTDRKGAARRELTQQDFRILEDGKDQKITSFAHEGAGASLGHSGKRFIALVFESDHNGLRQEVMQFVDRAASPDVYMAVFSRVNDELRLQQPFTADAGRVKEALRNMPTVPPLPKDSDWRKHTDLFERLSSVPEAVAPIRGRKAVILFSYGLYGTRNGAELQPDGTYRRYNAPATPVVVHLDKLADDCNAGNVSVYGFITNGQRAPDSGDYYNPPREAERDHGGATDFIRDLVTATGGKYMPAGAYDLASFLGTVSGDGSDYYLLGYNPSPDRKDNPCHKLRVKVGVSGLDVNARESYCTSGGAAGP